MQFKSPWAKSSLPSVFVNKVIWEHSHAHSFTNSFISNYDYKVVIQREWRVKPKIFIIFTFKKKDFLSQLQAKNISYSLLLTTSIPDHLTCHLRNLYAGQEARVKTGHGPTDWFQIGKGVRQGCILSPCFSSVQFSRSVISDSL